MNSSSLIIILACLIIIFIIGKIFFLPIKKVLKLMVNSILGGFTIYIINIIGASFNFHIGLNIFTSIFVGFLGIPGVILIILLQLI